MISNLPRIVIKDIRVQSWYIQTGTLDTRLSSSLNHRHILLQTLSENIDKGPLGIPLEQTCPQPEHCHSQCGGLEVRRCFRFVFQVDRGVRFFNNALRPAKYAALVLCKKHRVKNRNHADYSKKKTYRLRLDRGPPPRV